MLQLLWFTEPVTHMAEKFLLNCIFIWYRSCTLHTTVYLLTICWPRLHHNAATRGFGRYDDELSLPLFYCNQSFRQLSSTARTTASNAPFSFGHYGRQGMKLIGRMRKLHGKWPMSITTVVHVYIVCSVSRACIPVHTDIIV